MDRAKGLTQAYSQAPWRKQLQVFVVFSIVLVFGALVAGIYLYVTAQSAAVGSHILEMQKEIRDLERVNEDLRSQLALVSSAAEMEKRARAMGFQSIDTTDSLYVLVPGYTNRQPVVLAPAPGPMVSDKNQLPPEYTESLFEWFEKQVLAPPLPFMGIN
jgi:cell division protein FtsL